MADQHSEKWNSSKNTKKNAHKIQLTNDCSIGSKKSAHVLGYFEDDLLAYVWPKKVRRSPLINRGYWIRHHTMQNHVNRFCLKHTQNVQIISLGAGFDTRPFHTFYREHVSSYVEFDFGDVVRRKKEGLENNGFEYPEGIDGYYKMYGVDLENIQELKKIVELQVAGVENRLDFSKPTLLMCEVSTCYMDADAVNRVFEYFAGAFENLNLITYEQIRPDDCFGRVMMHHFNKINGPLRGLDRYPDEKSISDRYLKCGFKSTKTVNLMKHYEGVCSEEKRRLSKIEVFDEEEAFAIKCAHYIIGQASNFEDLTETSLESLNLDSEPPIDLKCSELFVDGIKRYGHSSKLINHGQISITGGFGENEKKEHSRELPDLLLNLDSRCVEKSYDEKTENPTMFGAYDFPGRTSPGKSGTSWKFQSCNGVKIGGREFIDKSQINEVVNSENPALARYNGSLTKVCDEYYLLLGGLDSEHEICKFHFLLDLELNIVKKLSIGGEHGISGIFNQSCHFINNELIIIGGVDNNGFETGVLKCKIEDSTIKITKRFSLEKHHPDIMLVNHTSHELPDKNQILVIGGGMNCFSFGTHLNSECLLIDVDQL